MAITQKAELSAFDALTTLIVKSFAVRPCFGHFGSTLHPWLDRARRAAMKPYIIGAIIVWFIAGFAGAVLLGQQRVEVRTIAGGPISFWNGLNKPVDS
jgi:hypothetical protein